MNTPTIVKAGLVGTLAAAAAFALGGSAADAHGGLPVVNVPHANPKFGIQNNVLTPSATQTSVAWGNLPLTNPDTANGVTHYGYNTLDGAPLTQTTNEAHKTEPDKNVYLVLGGKHYLYQGHEIGPRGYVTRINLDETDPPSGSRSSPTPTPAGNAYPTIDGITWDPFTQQLLLTAESSSPKGGVFGVGLDANGDPVDGGKADAARRARLGRLRGHPERRRRQRLARRGHRRRGGERRQGAQQLRLPLRPDRQDRPHQGRQAPGPADRARRRLPGHDVASCQSNPSDPFIAELHTYGSSFATRWVTIHTGTTEAFDATAAAKAADATPLKRPENGVFRPGTGFKEFYFTETGDTSTSSTLPGAYGGVFRISQKSAERRHRPHLDRRGRRQGAHRLRQHRLRDDGRPARRRGRRRRPAHPAQRARLRLRLRPRHGREDEGSYAAAAVALPGRCASSPRAATRRRRSTR